jgi:hypothetical protein
MVPDYYAMLGVDPGADRAAIEAALARCQPAWSSGTRNPKTKHTFQSYLDQIPALRRTLLADLGSRAAYDAELAAARRAERDAKLDTLQRLIRLRAAKGGLSVSDRTLLRDEAVKLGLTPDDLDRLAEPIPPRPEAPVEDDPPDPPADVLDPVTRRQIRVALEHLRRRDLYDALGLTRDAPPGEIGARADAERQRWMQKAQVTAEKTAWLEVVSLAQSHLTAAAARARYDRTLAAEAEEALNAAIAFTLKGLARLDPGTRLALIDEGAALGIASDRTDRLIGRACKALGVARELAASPSTGNGVFRLLRCRNCSGVTEFQQASKGQKGATCRHCRASLRWDCPACRTVRWVDEARCVCGFRREDREPLLAHFAAAQQAFKTRQYAAVLDHLRWVQEAIPNHVGARKGIDRVRHRQAEIAQARASWEAARAGGKLVAGRAAVEAWRRLADPSDSEIAAAWNEVARGLRDAQALLARARSLETTDPPAARLLYRQALAIAADLPEAQSGLLRCPPDPPSRLASEFLANRVRLRWTPPVPDGLGPVSFVVLRKQGGPFEHPRDGSRIAEVAAPEFEDASIQPGETVSYAVLSTRAGVESVAAVAVEPIFLLGEVSDVRVETASRSIDLAWALPAGAVEARVVRKAGSAPANPKDGDRVEALRDRAHDRGLDDDRVYHYGLFAIYRLPDGRHVPSRGVFVSAQPHAPIGPLPAPSLAHDHEGRVRLDWPEPARGTVRILRTPRALPMAPGDRLTAAAADALEGQWIDTEAGRAFDPAPPPLGVCHYTPLTFWAGAATVGHGVSYSCVPDPSDLRAARVGNGGRVHLRWRWSPQGAESLVVARAGAAPEGPNDPEALVATVHEVEYSHQGHYTLNLPPTNGSPWHITVYSLATVNGERVVSPGVEPSARTVVPGPNPEVTVSYAFRRQGFPNRSWSLTFRTDPPGSMIPPTALVTHPRTVPLSVDDGEVVAHFPEARDGATFPIGAKIDLARQRARVFADPRAEPDRLSPIRLRHPEAEDPRA